MLRLGATRGQGCFCKKKGACLPYPKRKQWLQVFNATQNLSPIANKKLNFEQKVHQKGHLLIKIYSKANFNYPAAST